MYNHCLLLTFTWTNTKYSSCDVCTVSAELDAGVLGQYHTTKPASKSVDTVQTRSNLKIL